MRGSGARRVRAAGLAAVALAASACWPQHGGTSANQNANLIETIITPATAPSLFPAWTAPGVLDVVFGNQILGADASGPGVVGSGAFARVRSVDTVDGRERWAARIHGQASVRTATIAEPATVVGDGVEAGWYGSIDTPSGPVCGAATGGATLEGRAGDGLEVGLHHELTVFRDTRAHLFRFAGQRPGGSPDECELGGIGSLTVAGPAVTSANLQWTTAFAVTAGAGRPIVIDDQLLLAKGSTLLSFVASGCGTSPCEPTWTVDLGVTVADMAADSGDWL